MAFCGKNYYQTLGWVYDQDVEQWDAHCQMVAFVFGRDCDVVRTDLLALGPRYRPS